MSNIYFISNDGTDTSPYDSLSNASTTFKNLQDNIAFVNGDIINFVTSGGDIDDTNTSAIAGIEQSLTFQSYEENLENPTWLFDSYLTFSGDACNDTTFYGLDTSAFSSEWRDDVSNLTAERCNFTDESINRSFYFEDLTDTAKKLSVNGFTCNNNTFTNTGLTIEFGGDVENIEINNNILDATRIMQFDKVGGLQFRNVNVSNNNISNTNICFFLASTSADYDNVRISNNILDSDTNGPCYIDNLNTIKNLYYHDNNITNISTYGLYIATVNISVENLQIYNNTIDISMYGNLLQLDCDSTNNIIIKNNTISNMSNRGIFLACGTSANNIEIMDNFISDIDNFGIYVDSGSGTEYLTNVNIHNNIIKDVGGKHVLFSSQATSATNNIDISYNNLHNVTSASDHNIYFSSSTSATNVSINNNIIDETSATIFINTVDDSYLSFDYNNYYIEVLTFDITGDVTSGDNNIFNSPLWTDSANDNYYLLQNSPNIESGILSDTIGAIPYNGEFGIGAFYFGSAEKTFEVDPMNLNLDFISNIPTLGEDVDFNVSPMNLFLSFSEADILSYSDISIDFIGIPRVGTSPLVVDFTAYVTLLPEVYSDYYVSNYTWYFDSQVDLSTSASDTIPTISYTYTGYKGQQFSVKLDVVLTHK